MRRAVKSVEKVAPEGVASSEVVVAASELMRCVVRVRAESEEGEEGKVRIWLRAVSRGERGGGGGGGVVAQIGRCGRGRRRGFWWRGLWRRG